MNGNDHDEELTFFCLPMKTYRQLSIIARKKQRTVSQLIAGALQREILEYESSVDSVSRADREKPA